MNTQLVNSAAGVILAALQQNRTAAGIALALDSAQLLQSPEAAAGLDRLRARVAELEALLAQATEFRLSEPGYGLYVRQAPGARGFAVLEARRSDKGRRAWTTVGWQYSAVLSGAELFCWPDAVSAVAEARRVMPGAVVRDGSSVETADGITRRIAPTQALREGEDDVTPQVTKLRALLAGQRAAVEGEHYPTVHHDYRVPRDLPEAGDRS
ncbi:hypothetical protein ACH4ZX_03585 [Streptomyces sp. NPDC020490]|uniref:hypothetical protein n=1 Tax=Streptomyces sp. NPDC020490 TaxID=3365078 RepID=UPI00378AC02F